MAGNCVTSCGKNGSGSDAFLSCVNVAPLEPDSPALKDFFVRSGATQRELTNETLCYAIACIRAHRMIYAKKQWSGTDGDCPKQTSTSGAGTAALGIASSTGSGITGGLVAGGVGAGATLGTALSVATFGLSLLAIPFAFLSHHSRAVATEQQILCEVTTYFNSRAAAIEAAILQGEVTAQEAGDLLLQVRNQITGALSQIRKDCNFACGYIYSMDALVLFCREVLYPRLETPLGQIKNLASSPQGLLAMLALAVVGLKSFRVI